MATRRSTRQRKVIPIEELKQLESEADAEFWGQAAFADDGEDDEFDAAGESEEDVVDSDFDAPEAPAADADEEGEKAEKEARAEERAASRPKGGYVDPKKRKKRPASSSGKPPEKRARTSSGAAGAATTPARKPVKPRTGLRNSTKRASLKAAESRARREEEEAVRRAKRAAREARREPVREPTQEEKLAEAVETEKANAESLRDLLSLEEERKRVPMRKKKRRGQILSLRDRNGITTISFRDPKTNTKQVLFPQLEQESEPTTPSEQEELAELAEEEGNEEQEGQAEQEEQVEQATTKNDVEQAEKTTENEGVTNPEPGGTSNAVEGNEEAESKKSGQEGDVEMNVDVAGDSENKPTSTVPEAAKNGTQSATNESERTEQVTATESKSGDTPSVTSKSATIIEAIGNEVPAAGATSGNVTATTRDGAPMDEGD